jgi:hypothetical protein
MRTACSDPSDGGGSGCWKRALVQRLMLSLFLIVLLTGAAVLAGEPAEGSSRVLEMSLRKQLAGRALVPSYVSLAPHIPPAGPTDSAADSTKNKPSGHYLSALPGYFIGVERHALSTAGCTWRGASIGAGYGLLIGAVGTTTGLFDEDDAFYIIGAMSLLGALLGGTLGPENAAFSSDWRWEAAKRQFDWREDQEKFDRER